MIDATILRALQAAGATTDMIIAAVEADCALDAERKEKKRAGNRERQRRFREARNADNALQGVTERDSALPPPPPDKSPPDPQKLTPTPALTGEPKPRARKADPFPCPEGVDPTAWAGLIANRRAKRAGLSEGAYNQIIAKLHRWAEDGWPPGPIVAHAAELGWTTVFETDEMKGRQNGRQPPPLGRHQPSGGIGPNVRAAQRVFGTG